MSAAPMEGRGAFLKRFRHLDDGLVTRSEALLAFLKEEIAFGRLKCGETLPTIREIAEGANVTFASARAVLERLARDGFVRSRPRVGSVVLARETAVVHGRILFALPDVDAGSYHAMIAADAMRRRLAKAGYIFTAVVFPQDAGKVQQQLAHELCNPPDLAIVMYSNRAVRACLKQAGVPCVYLYGDCPKGEVARWIRFTPDEAMGNFVTHCLRAGVGRVTQVRFRGNETPDAHDALAAAGIASTWLVVDPLEGYGRYEGIERAAYKAFMDVPEKDFPDVYLFWDDFVAQGALTAFLRRGVNLPRDVNVATLANEGLGPVYCEPLTRFSCDPASAGARTADFALDVLLKGRLPPPPIVAPDYVFGATFPY